MAAAKKSPAAVEAVETAVQAAMAPMTQMQEKVRETAEKGMEQARAQYEAVKDAAEKATGKLEESVNAVRTGAMSFNLKALELVRTNTNASFDHLQALFGAKTVQDAMTLQADFVKKQAEAAQAQIQDLAAIGQKLASDAAEPVKSFAASMQK
mgnify:CR=1 FL=1